MKSSAKPIEHDIEPNESQKLNAEMILRKSFLDCAKDYGRNCSLAGAKQMCNPDICLCERLIWAVLFFASVATVAYFLQFVWSNALSTPLIVTLESSEYPIKFIDFPAIAICNKNRISKRALEKFANDEYSDIAKHHESLEEVQKLLLNFGRLIDYSYNDSQRNHPVILRIIEKYHHQPNKIADIMKMLAPSCDDMLLRCGWAGVEVDCQDLFSTRRTANRGHCCTYNYVLDHKIIRAGKSLPEIKKQSTPGDIQGLTIVLDPMLDDYAYPLSNIKGFDVLIFDPMHYPDPSSGRVVHRMSEPNAVVFFELKSTKQTASKEVRKYSLETRQCLFPNEFPEYFFNMYSYSSCIVMCRLVTIQSLCKCTPYFVTAHHSYLTTKACTLEDLKCLNKYKEKLYYLYPYNAVDVSGLETELEDSLSCDCSPDCEFTQHKTKSIESGTLFSGSDLRKSFQESIFDGIDMRNKSVLCVYHPTGDATLVRLDVVSYWYEVLSNVGGFCGMIFGFSILSVYEFLYFFTIRFLHYARANYKQYY